MARAEIYLPLYIAEVQNAWIQTSASSYGFMALCLIKHKDNFTSIFARRILYFQKEVKTGQLGRQI
jgi:hypothetical protein